MAICAVLAFSITDSVFGQNKKSAVLEFDENFAPKDTVRIPYGKKIVLTGVLKKNVTKVQITSMVNESVQTYETGSDANGRWIQVAGPYPVNSDVIFIFSAFAALSSDEKAKLREMIREALMEFAGKMSSEFKQIDKDDYKTYAAPMFMQALPNGIGNYKNEDGITLDELLLTDFRNLDLDEMLKVVNYPLANRNDRKVISKYLGSNFIQRYEANKDKLQSELKDLAILDAALNYSENQPDDPELFTKLVSGTVGAGLSEEDSLYFSTIFAECDKVHKDILERIAFIDGFIEKTVAEIEYSTLESFTSVIGGQTSAEVSGLEYFAGFDVGALSVSDSWDAGWFFFVSPYFGKKEIDSPADFEKIQLQLVTFGAGVETSKYDTNDPVFYIGPSFLYNPYFRIHMGCAAVKPPDKSGYEARFAFGFSIKFRYIDDFFRIFGSAAAGVADR